MKTNLLTKKLTALLLVFGMTAGIFPAPSFAKTGTLEGDGSADNPYLIEDVYDLETFRNIVNTSDSCESCAKLTCDIELSGEWTPFNSVSGYVTTAFKGTFDGDYHKISGLYINSDSSNQGLFACINGGTVKNLIVEGNVTSSNSYIGGIVGKIQQGTVVNCAFQGSVITTKSGGYAGGIAGYAGNTASQTAVISGCVNNADITGETRGFAGGITGYAKYANITDCYNTGKINGASRSGGIAGQLQNNCTASNCYNTGIINGSETASDICDFLYSSSMLSNCYYNKQAYGAGTGTAENCAEIADTELLLSNLGNSFAADDNGINNGYPVLEWQVSSEPVPKDPHITVSGSSKLYMTNSGTQPQITLTVQFTDMEPVPIIWSVKDADNTVILEEPADNDENNRNILVQANKPGKATVTAVTENGEYSAIQEITIFPFVTTTEIDGTVMIGETVKARVNILGGDEFNYNDYPELIYQWRYITAEDYLNGNTTAYQDISGEINREFTIPAELEGAYLSFSFLYNGEYKTISSPLIVHSADYKKAEKLEETKKTLGEYYKMYPVFGKDTNVIDILKADLNKIGADCSDIDISIKSTEEVYGGAGIDNNGDITYFYDDPNNIPSIRMGSCKVTFSLSIDNTSTDFEVPVIIYWDRDKVKETMEEEILSNVTDVSILGENTSADYITGNLILPKIVDDKKWTLISWQSSDSNVISISDENQTTADTLFNPYIGKVTRGAEDKNVTLTAVFTFMLTNDVTGNEQPITMSKVYNLMIKAAGAEQLDAIRDELNKKLDAGFEKAGIRDAVTENELSFADNTYTAYDDILFPSTRDFGIDGKYYPISITSSNEDIIKSPDVNNSARVTVYRPAAGSGDAKTKVTVTITDTNSNVSVSRTFDMIVPALTQAEIDSEKALMNKVKASYFNGIKGENTDAGNISKNLTPFQEVYEKDGSLVWVRDKDSRVNHGIIAVPIDGWEELEAWRLFKSSNPASVTHENLLVSMQKKAKAVNISSVLSSETLGKYGELYQTDPVKYSGYAQLADLYYQAVSADLVIRGKSTAVNMRPMAVEEKINVSFRLQDSDSTLISNVSYKNLDEGTTVFDIFKKALGENGYTYKTRGSYVYSITSPDGRTIAELQDGADSGWMYKVNGDIPDMNMGGCGLKNGDEIVVFFTKDYTAEKNYKKHSSSASLNNEPSPIPTISAEPTASPQNEPAGNLTEPKYADIQGHWAENAIKYVTRKGMMYGISDSKFEPDSNLTRAMFVTVLYRIENEPDAPKHHFTDIEGGIWYEKAVKWAVSNNIVYGISDTEFAPDLNISREQMAAILYRYAEFKGYDNSASKDINYTDKNSISEYAKDAVVWANENAVMCGDENNAFKPKNNARRCETAMIFMNFTESFK